MNFQIELPDHFKVGLFSMYDAQPNGVQGIDPDDAWKFNSEGHGIFWTLNEFRGARKMENLVNVLRWGVDMDDGPKEDQLKKILAAPMLPSEVNETKRGYQVCYYAKDASPHFWNAIVMDRLVPYFGADKRARDLCRIFRVPGFFHNKDPKNPFLVNNIYYKPQHIYTDSQMAYGFKDMSAPAREQYKESLGSSYSASDGFFMNLFNADHQDLLAKVSGHKIVGGETYEFKRQANGNYNIHVDGKGTSTFIDKHGRIGSLDGGGPTLIQWLTWHGHTKSKAIQFIKEEFPWLKSSN